MIQEEIARLTGTLKFNVDARPLVTFEKRLAKVTGMLKEFSEVANKKFQIKVALDSRTLRAQLEKAANAKVVFKNFSIDEASLTAIAQKMAGKLDNTPIRLKNVKIDIADLLAQKKFIKTSLGNVEVNLHAKIHGKEGELRKWVKDVEDRLKIKLRVELIQAQFDAAVRKAIRHASTTAGAVNIKVADPKVKLKVDRDHIQSQLRDMIQQHEYQVRVRVSGGGGPDGRRTSRAAAGGGMAGAGLVGAGMGFARGALPGLGAAWALGQINQINQDLQASTNALQAVSGDSTDFAANMAFLEKITEEQGRQMRDVAPAFTSVLASAGKSIGAEGTRDLFQGVMKYSTVMGLDQEAMKGTFRAIGQMFSKDKIQAEEAQGQLAERLPAAMQLLAEANNSTVKELREQMQKGELDPKKILPEMARIMETLAEANGSYTRALESTRVQQGRMNRQFEKTIKVFSEAGFDVGMGRFFRTMANSMRDAEPTVKALGGAFEILSNGLNAIIESFVILGNFLAENVAPALGLTAKQLYAILGVVAVAAMPFGMLALAITGVALALSDLVGFAQGKDSMFGRWLETTPEAKKAFDELKVSFENFKVAVGDAWDIAKKLAGELKGLNFSDMLVSTMKEISMILNAITAVLDRLHQANVFSKEQSGGSTVDRVFRFAQGALSTPEELENFKLRSETAASVSKNAASTTSPMTLSSEQQSKDLATAFAAALSEREASVGSAIQMNVPITITGIEDKAAMADFMQERIKAATNQALYDWADRARARQKDIK